MNGPLFAAGFLLLAGPLLFAGNLLKMQSCKVLTLLTLNGNQAKVILPVKKQTDGFAYPQDMMTTVIPVGIPTVRLCNNF